VTRLGQLSQSSSNSAAADRHLLELGQGVESSCGDKQAGPNAKVRFWVIEVGTDATVSLRATHQTTLALDPRHCGVTGERRAHSRSQEMTHVHRSTQGTLSPGLLSPAAGLTSRCGPRGGSVYGLGRLVE
jgi:hypothetical protein